jgi:hypothetical protein
MSLSQKQKDEIRYALRHKTFSVPAEIAKLVNLGYSEDEAKALLANEVDEFKNEFRNELFQQKVKSNDQEDVQKIISIAIIMIAMIGPVFDIRSPIWYMLAFAGCGIAGYFAYKTKPIAGVIGAIIVPVILPFSYNWYFTGRTRYIKIELLIPLLVAIIPAVIIYFIIAKTVYANRESYEN